MDNESILSGGYMGNIDESCAHRWRVLQNTPDGYAECQHCGVQVELKRVIDALLVEAQPE